MLVAEGAVDVAVDAIGVAPYDLAAAIGRSSRPPAERFTDRHGARTYEHDSAISTNGLLHAEVIAALHR